MQNHSLNQNGRKYSFTPSDGVTTSISVLSLKDSVSGYTLRKGDKKTPTSFSYTAYRSNGYKGTYRYHNKTAAPPIVLIDSGSMGTFLDDRLNLTSNQAHLYNRAYNSLVNKLRGTLDLSIAVAEGHQTAAMLGSLNKLETYVKKWGPKISGLKTAGANWLAYSLGLRPLLQDVYGSVDEFYRHKVPGLLQIKTGARDTFDNKAVLKERPNDPQTTAVGNGVEGYLFHLQFQDSGGFDLKRWTSLNPASIAWELTPYSFVVDYVYDIGNYLRQLETSLLYASAFVSGYHTYLYAYDYSHRDLGVRNDQKSSFEYSDVTASVSRRVFTRTVLTSMPAPQLPRFKLPTAWQQFVTSAALLTTFLGKR